MNELLERAAEWRLLGLLLERPRPERREELAALAREVGDPALRSIAIELRDLDEGLYLELLGPGGPASPREVAYRWHDDPGWTLSDLASTYSAFGYRPRAEDPADHVAVETGFVAYLWLKEAYARLRGEGADVTREARERFVAAHLSTLAAGLASRLEPAPAPALLALARALLERTGPPPARLATATGSEDETPLACGPCPGA